MASERQAIGYIRGRDSQSSINGIAKFYNVNNGTLIEVEVKGLPNKDKNNFFGFCTKITIACTFFLLS